MGKSNGQSKITLLLSVINYIKLGCQMLLYEESVRKKKKYHKGQITVIHRRLPGSLRIKFTLQGTQCSAVINMLECLCQQAT